MKKYKLIKEYPGSPMLGIILEYNDKVHQACTLDKKHYYNGIIITNYPEYWEEVDEKDYEILSLYSVNSPDKIFRKNHPKNKELKFYKDHWYCDGGTHLKPVCNNDYKIYSVKRLSDDEVFTVDDTTNKGIIKEFLNYNNTIHASCKKENHTGYFSGNIDKLQHIKKPLFTTEDGVDIFEGDKVFSVNRTNFQHYDNNRIITNNFCRSSVYKYFSTKEAAENYVLMNKPCLSINDILSINQWNLVETKTSTTNKLKKIVKSKL